MNIRYVFYTDDINKPILDGYSDDIVAKIVIDLKELQVDQKFVLEDNNYKIIEIYPNKKTSPNIEIGMNILCEELL